MKRLNVALLGCPLRPDIEWTKANLQKLKDSGFNAVQLNIAWGARAGDEPMSLEDIVELPDAKVHLRPTNLPPLKSFPARWDERCAQLKQRISLAKQMGFRTIFHFGAPYNAHYGFSQQFDENNELPLCVQDPQVTDYYKVLLDAFATEYEGVDDILIYTYDQNAWLCSEFGICHRCSGVPLHERVTKFLDMFGQRWKSLGRGKVWWEPWELSAGQVYKCIEVFESDNIHLSLHSNIAEVMASLPVDKWFENTCQLAKSKGMDVIGEGFFGATNEEVEPLLNVWAPLVTHKQVKKILAVDNVLGIKEYYGLLPDRYDMNLEMTALTLKNPDKTADQLLDELVEPFGDSKGQVKRFVTLCSDAMDYFPWQTSWLIRKIGRATEKHSLDGALVRGFVCSTPAWDSTRGEIFLKTENSQPHPWLIEDVQLRLSLSVQKMQEALELGGTWVDKVPPKLQESFEAVLEDYAFILKIAKSYIYHLRETNLAETMRFCKKKNRDILARSIREMREILEKDIANQNGAAEITKALKVFNADIDRFLETYFRLDKEDKISKGPHTLTSR